MNARVLIVSADTAVAVIATGAGAFILPNQLNASFTVAFYGTGITVLSIIFSLFFACISIIMTSSDDDFIRFLDDENIFKALLANFRITLGALFISLMIAIALYTGTDYYVKQFPEGYVQSSYVFLFFLFFFVYSLTATALSSNDAIRFSMKRAEYLRLKQ